MSRPGAISGLEWEDRLLKFLRVELAPTPGRARAAARIVVACLVATAVVMTCHSPHASFIIITIFVLSQSNAGASMTKAMWRVLGTAFGAAVGLAAYVSFLDHPWLRVALMGPLAAFFIFLSQTTTAPYFGLLGGITAVMIMSITGPDADTGLHTALWRFAMIALGSFIATAAQIFLWPDDPEELLYASLDERLAAIEDLLLSMRESRRPETKKLDALILTGLSRQLDLLDHSEARYPSLRHRHAEQVSLIGGIERMLTSTVSFARAARGDNFTVPSPARARVSAILSDCARLRDALKNRLPVGHLKGAAALPSDAEVAAAGGAALLPGLIDIEEAFASLPGVIGCLERRRKARSTAPSLAALDSPSRAAFFTPAFSLANVDGIVFSARAGLAATLAFVLYEGMAWPGLATSVWTALLVAQSTLGASVQKGILRLAGAGIGGLLGLLMIVVIMPNIDSLAPLLMVVAVCTGIAAWFAAGSTRISYVGIQIGLAFGLCLLNEPGPTTDLVPARDRVFGVLLGIGVWGFLFGLTGSVLAGTAMRRSLAASVRSLAGLARVGLRGDPTPATVAPARGWRWTVYQNLATTMRLHDESKFEWGAGVATAEAERARITRLTADAQAVFLPLLALIHHRHRENFAAMPPVLRTELQNLAQAVVARLEAIANRIQGRSEGPSPALGPLFARAKELAIEVAPTLDEMLRTHVPGRIALYEELLRHLEQLDRDASPRATPSPAGLLSGNAPATI